MYLDFEKFKNIIRKYALECSGGLLMGLSIMFGGIGGLTVIVMTIIGEIDVEDSGGWFIYLLKLVLIIGGSVLAFLLGLYLFKKSKEAPKMKVKKNKYADFSSIKGVKEDSDSVTLSASYVKNLSDFGIKGGPVDINLAVVITDYLTKRGFNMEYAEIGFLGDAVPIEAYNRKYTDSAVFINKAIDDFNKKSKEMAEDLRTSFRGLSYEYVRLEFTKNGESLFIDTKNDVYIRMSLKKESVTIETVKNLLYYLNITYDVKTDSSVLVSEKDSVTDDKIRNILNNNSISVDIEKINLSEKSLQEDDLSVQFKKGFTFFDSGIKALREKDGVKFYRYIAAANKNTVTENAKSHIALFKYEKKVPYSDIDNFSADYYAPETKWEKTIYKSDVSYFGYGSDELVEILLNKNPEFKKWALSKDKIERVLKRAEEERLARLGKEEIRKAEALKRDEEYKKKQEEARKKAKERNSRVSAYDKNVKDYMNSKVPVPEKGPFAPVEKLRFRLHHAFAIGGERNILFSLGPNFDTYYGGRKWDSAEVGFDLRKGKPYIELMEGYGGWAPRTYKSTVSFEEFHELASKHAPKYVKVTPENWQEYFKDKIEKLKDPEPEIKPVKVVGADVYSVTDEMRENFSYAFILLNQMYGASVVYFRKCGDEFRAFTATTRENGASIPNFIGSLREEYITKIMEGTVSIGSVDAYDRVLTEEEADYLLYCVNRKHDNDNDSWSSMMGGDHVSGAVYFKDSYIEANKTYKFIELKSIISAVAQGGAVIARE